MLIYKEALRQYDNVAMLLRANRLSTYLDLAQALGSWSRSISKIEIFDLTDEGSEEERRHLVHACTMSAAEAKGALTCFALTYEREATRRAEAVYRMILAWADDVVDGLWPSSHPAADRHDDYEIAEAEDSLLLAAAKEIGIVSEELRDVAQGFGPKLGGTGKRY